MTRARAMLPPETALYAPVKALLEAQGYEVKSEVNGCDVVAVRGDAPPVIVELKRTFGLGLVLQGMDRLAMTDAVYLAVGAWPPRVDDVRRLLRRVGLGLIVVAQGRADLVLDPVPYQPRRNRRRAERLLLEHRRRIGDPNTGGATRRPIMTAYRQEAERCLGHLCAGPASLRALRAAGDVPHAATILRGDVYGWFERVERGVYGLTPKGERALAEAEMRDGASALAEPHATPPRRTPGT
jgi:hypothetical protein